MEEFRLGIQKCRKTIQCTVEEFNVDGTGDLFQTLRSECEKASSRTNVEHVSQKDMKK